MRLITLLITLIASAPQEEWLQESSIPVEYPTNPAPEVTQLPVEQKTEKTHSKSYKVKKPSKRISKVSK